MAEVESARDLEDGDLRSYRIKAFAWILGGLIVLVACLLIVDYGERRSDVLVAQADEVPGIVTGGFRNRQIKWVTVEFTYEGESRRRRRIRQILAGRPFPRPEASRKVIVVDGVDTIEERPSANG